VSANKGSDRFVCPQCGSQDVVPIVYGLPGPELMEAAARGEVMLGGCVLGLQNRGCRACGARFHLEEAHFQSASEENKRQDRVPKRKQYRNLKPELAPPDDEIYKLGFVVGGKRLVGEKKKKSKK
jgi:transcription elongation factor Elf1